jgi:DEAD/DEAH box helicase domain-containing protein
VPGQDENEPSIGPNTESPSSTSTIPTKTQDGGKKPRRTKVAGANPPILRHSSSTNLVETSVSWPDHLKQLSQLHRALNLVYTFCYTRKHFATTFENMKSAAEGHTKRPLLIEDVAQVKALIPRAITFAYVDEDMLLVTIMGEEDGIKGGRTDHFRSLAEDESGQKEAENCSQKELFLFEFVDGDLKRQVTDPKTGLPVKATQKLRIEELKMPVFSRKQMLKLIEKRNAKFTSAINAFLNDYAEKNVDAVERIKSDKDNFIPVPSESRGDTPGPTTNTTPKQIPKDRDSISDIVKQITELEWYTHQIVPDGHRVFDPQPAIYGELNFALSQSLVNVLYNSRGITQLYAHQAEAINNLYDGHSVIVSISTSSGKSLIYQVPMLHALEQDSHSRGMYIFPTKALAQDQHYMQNPDEIFTKPNCELQVDLTNELVVEGHIQCAAYGMPI